jgi:hypothetical protein
MSILDILDVVFQAEGWAIARYTDHMLRGYPGVHAHHIGCNVGTVATLHWERWERQICSNCGVPVPEGIVALVLLHDWDKL